MNRKKKGGISNLHTPEIFEEAYNRRDWNFYRGLLSECIKYGMPGKWLDLGAGLGLFVECAHRFGIDCIGIEGSEYAVNKARERVEGIVMVQSLLENPLPVADNSISTIICNQTIEHINQVTARYMLKESHRVLKPGGIIFINSPSKFNPKEKYGKTHINLYSPTSLRKEIERAGFSIVKTTNQPIPVLGHRRVALFVTRVLFTLFPVDFFSATANCIAKKMK